MKIVMLGAPGAGKGTQAIKIADKYDIPHISTGDIFRANIKGGTELGQKAKSYIDKGELVPDEVTIGMLLDRIAQDDCSNGYVLDGFPRTIPQAESLTEALKSQGDKIDFALNIDVPDEAIIKRMSGRRACPKCGATYHIVYAAPKKENICDKCGSELIIRSDDKPETVKDRLNVYHQQTEPLIAYYKAAGVLREVDGTQELPKVFEDVVAILSEN
ncbi:MAG TPA: adenylate kinase [Oribacterium sp.]|nr:adenylate kinase [Oribacterium sp.]HCS66778.1 adenylate kinase [Oribacterium sp.]